MGIDRHGTLHSPSVSVCAKTTKRFVRMAAQHPIDRRSGTSAPQLCPVRRACLGGIGEQAIHGSFHPHRRNGCVVLLQSFFIGQLHFIEGDRARTKLASTSPTQINPNWTSTCSLFKGATGQPVFNWQSGTFRCSVPGSTTALQMTALQLQSLLIIVFTEGESAKPLGPPEQVPQLQAHCRGVVLRIG